MQDFGASLLFWYRARKQIFLHNSPSNFDLHQIVRIYMWQWIWLIERLQVFNYDPESAAKQAAFLISTKADSPYVPL
jgi:hypothetical protein